MIKEGEKLLFAITVLIVGGIIMVGSASYIKAMEKFGNPMFFLKKHIIFAGTGIFLIVILLKVPISLYKRLAYPIFIVSILSLIAVFIPSLGVEVHDSSRWLKIGGIQFQPSEFAKVSYAIFISSILSEGRNRKYLTTLILILLAVILMFVLLIMEPDYGTAAFFVIITLAGLFIYGLDSRWFLIMGFIAVAILLFFAFHGNYRAKRVRAFLNPEAYPDDAFQIRQSLYAIGSGGIKGTGIGEGKAKYHFLPEPYTDYIFSVIGEELGFIGVLGVLAIYFVFFRAGISIALKSADIFTSLLVSLLTMSIVIQALIHIGVTLGLLPPKGMTLPFISYGGSSLLASCISAGIILRAWKEVDDE